MGSWLWLMVLLVCALTGQARGCCGDPDDPAPRVERSARRHRWHTNGTALGRRGGVRVRRGMLRIPLDRLKEIQNMDLGALLDSVRGASHPAFVSFIASSNATAAGPMTTLGTGLLGAGRPAVQGSGPSSLQMDLNEVASERRNVIKDAGCKPRKMPVQVPLPDDPLLLYTPSCVLIQRCSGCCGHELLECVPTKVKTIRKKVLALRFSVEDSSTSLADQESSVKRIKMEKHVKCDCQCKVKRSDCSPRQRYDAGNCRCLCPNEHEAATCPGTKIWSETDCACRCAEVHECSTGLEFDPVQCRCLVSPSRPLLFATGSQPTGSSATDPAWNTRATPTSPGHRSTQAGRTDQEFRPTTSGGTSSSGWGFGVSSGVISDGLPPSLRPSRTSSVYQSTYRPAARADWERRASPGYGRADSEARYSVGPSDQAGATSRYDRGYDRTWSSSGYDRGYQASGYPAPYGDRRLG